MLWPSRVAPLVSAFALLTVALPVRAQPIPDGTLGAESSIVIPGIEVRGDLADRIEGGAIRGGNLFHSFTDFNIPDGERVYFANPLGIDSILSRVTGGNPSSIFGTLGVDGSADLFLINPNGIVFGVNAVLDVDGSFYGTTAEAIEIGEGLFSAVAPEQSQLLSVNPNTSFWNYLTENSGDIENRGQLAVGGNLVLAGNSLDLQNQVAAAGDLSLLATDTVQIRDTTTVPFIGYAGGDLLVQGNQQVDIVALNHPESGLLSGGDMVLRSAEPVGGDAHYWSGGDFRVEGLTGEGGDLYSPEDPIIFADGDISLESYVGASLHIFAGGSIAIPFIRISGADTTDTSITQNVSLSNGDTISIDGTNRSILDLRAGIDWLSFLDTLPGNLNAGISIDPSAFGDSATSANILVGNIEIEEPGGTVFLTNQFLPNQLLETANIFLAGNIEAFGSGGDGSSITVDSRGDLTFFPILSNEVGDVAGGFIDASSDTANGGDITLLAQGAIQLLNAQEERIAVVVTNTYPRSLGNPGKVQISAETLTIGDAQISNTAFADGNVPLIEINTSGNVSLNNSQIFSTISLGAVGDTEGITIDAGSLNMTGNSQILSIIREPIFEFPASQGNAGDIVLNVTGDIFIIGTTPVTNSQGDLMPGGGTIASALASETSGTAGNIIITANNLTLGNFANLRSSIDLEASGEAGDITLTVSNLYLDNRSLITSLTAGIGNAGIIDIDAAGDISLENRSAISSQSVLGASGDAGRIDIDANTMTVASGSRVQSSVSGTSTDFLASSGNSGAIDIRVTDQIVVDGEAEGQESRISTDLGQDVIGTGGDITIQANSLVLRNSAKLDARTRGTGPAGDVEVTSNQVFISNDAGIRTDTRSDGDAGNVDLRINHLDVSSGGFILTDALEGGSGSGGQIIVDASQSVRIDGVSSADVGTSGIPDASGLYAQTRSDGDAGNIFLTTNDLIVSNGGSISTETSGTGNGGDLLVDADFILVEGGSPDQSFSSSINASAETGSSGNAGSVFVSTQQLIARDGGFIASSAETGSIGNAGNVIIRSTDLIELNGLTLDRDNPTAISVGVQEGASGNSGDIDIETAYLRLRDGGRILASNFGSGQDGGSIQIRARESVEVVSGNNAISLINASSGPSATGQSGSIDLQTRQLRLQDGGQITASTFGAARAGDIEISADDSIQISGFSTDGFFTSAILARSLFWVQEIVGEDGNPVFLALPATGQGGNIYLETDLIDITNFGEISSESFGTANAGGIELNIDTLEMRDGNISTASLGGSGGDIRIEANDIRLFRDSDISTSVGIGDGNGGNIRIIADSVVALDDSDILTFAFEGRGGDIDLSQTSFFGENYMPGTSPPFDGNNRVDINASGRLASGTISLPDVSAIENSLSELPDNLVNTETLLANSCIARRNDTSGTFVLTGTDSLPQQPDTAEVTYTLGTVQALPTAEQANTEIIEPQGVYRLADGRLVMSRECEG
jgi:filamentous hemagglutinin family protein